MFSPSSSADEMETVKKFGLQRLPGCQTEGQWAAKGLLEPFRYGAQSPGWVTSHLRFWAESILLVLTLPLLEQLTSRQTWERIRKGKGGRGAKSNQNTTVSATCWSKIDLVRTTNKMGLLQSSEVITPPERSS